MQQLRECQFSKAVALVRNSAHVNMRCLQSCKLAVFFSRAILAAENKPSLNATVEQNINF